MERVNGNERFQTNDIINTRIHASVTLQFYLKNGFNKNEYFFQFYLWRYSVKTQWIAHAWTDRPPIFDRESFWRFLLCSDTFLHYKVSYSYSIPFLSAKFMFWNLQEHFGRRSKNCSSCWNKLLRSGPRIPKTRSKQSENLVF
jgi:hypothetical protein